MSTETVPGESSTVDTSAARRWQPIGATERRVLGVLVEKAKTTPENYPLSSNGIRTGSNQKNNRAPLMQLNEDQVEEALESLRRLGAVAEIQGSGRVDKYRHLAYEWLGVDKIELAVMAELLLRGAQTVGELRGRAARMEPIKDLGELRPVLDSLTAKGLLVHLTPPGRGAVVTHTLYRDQEMEKVRREAAAFSPSDAADEDELPRAAAPSAAPRVQSSAAPRLPDPGLAADVAKLREEIAAMKRDFAATVSDFESTTRELRDGLDELNRQLGN
jgi:uncharacterized protein YceH (UPF0502 family)